MIKDGKMDNKTYLEESSRSVAPDIHMELTQEEASLLRRTMMDGIVSGEQCDGLKRKLFYGLDYTDKGLPQSVLDLERVSPDTLAAGLKGFIALYSNNPAINPIDLIHGIIGSQGESGELLEALSISVLDNQVPVDLVNIVEECGDKLWYIALTLRAVGSTIDEAMELNIEKLKKRYPGLWTQEAVLNRDLDGEREILEKSKTA